MKYRDAERLHGLASCFLLIACFGLPVAADPPDLEQNPVTTYLESVDIATDSGSRVRHCIDKGLGGCGGALISTAAGQSPRVAISSAGRTWVVWWQTSGANEIYYRHRPPDLGTWTPERRLSVHGEDSRFPEIVHDGSTAWVAYQITSGATKSIAVLGVIDDPEPFPVRDIVSSTSYEGDIDVLVHAESGQVWVTWVDDPSYVGWTQRSAGAWTTPQYESWTGTTIEEARATIRDAVLGP